LQERIRTHIRLANDLKAWVERSEWFELMAPVPFSTVCFRFRPRQASGPEANPPCEESDTFVNHLNERLLAAINATGRVFLSHTKIRGKFALRCAIGNIRTEQKHIAELYGILDETARNLKRESS
jgi:aromatic-L-amino-acid decarboxylase